MPDPTAGDGIGAQAPRPGTLFYGWILVAVFWLILVANLAFPMYGGAVLNNAMATELGFSHEMLGLPFAIFLGTVGLGSPLVAAIIYRIGVRWTLVIGNLVVAAGAALMAGLVHNAIEAVLVYGLVIGFGVSSGGNLTAQTAIAKWFVRRRSIAFALMLSASAIGGFVAPPILTAVMREAGGWRAGWWLVAALAVAVAALAAITVREDPAALGQYPDGLDRIPRTAQASQSLARGSWRLADAVRNSKFWALAFASSMATGSFGLAVAHGIANAQRAGYTPTEGAWAIASLSAAGLGGKAAAALARDPVRVWICLMALMAIGLAIASTAMPFHSLYVFALLLGVGFGGVVVCQPASVANLVGAGHFARIISLIYFVQALAGITFPWLSGRLVDAFGSYRIPFYVAAAGCAMSSLLLWWAMRTVRMPPTMTEPTP